MAGRAISQECRGKDSKTLSKQNYKLAKNDIIKLGRVKFRIKDLFIPGIDGESRVMDVPF